MRGKQDFLVVAFYYLGFSRIRNLLLRLSHKPVTRIVTFHDILPEMLDRFKSDLIFLKQETNVVTLDDYFSVRLSSRKINVIITFDDGYKSWISHALPVLKESQLPATFFISSGFIGLSKDEEAEFIRSKLFLSGIPRRISGGIKYDDVRRIVDEGFEIGGHTLDHCNLTKLQVSAQARYEIAEDKIRLERIARKQIRYFAYPSGAYHNSIIDLPKILKESGYIGALTTLSGFNNVGTNPYQLKRELTSASMPKIVFKTRVYGNNDAVQFLHRLTRYSKRNNRSCLD